MIEPFFSKQSSKSISRPDGKVVSCYSCGLYRDCLSPKMPPYGNFHKGIMVIGEAPGQREDMLNAPWQGQAGERLFHELAAFGIDLFQDCICINACSCRPISNTGANRTPEPMEITCCRPRVLQAIAHYKPHLILLFGMIPVRSVIEHRWGGNMDTFGKWRGWCIPDRDFNAWVCPTYHPSYLERSIGTAKEHLLNTLFRQDLERALAKLDKPFPFYEDETKYVEIVDDLRVLEKHRNAEFVAFDYETTGIKPHRPGHRIVSASIAVGPKKAYAFIMPKKPILRQPFIAMLTDPRVNKSAHNIKFEWTWSKVKLNIEVLSLVWCSLQAAHILDNRARISGLKFQTYVNFGIADYASEIRPFLESHSKDGNAFNKIMDLLKSPLGTHNLLMYGGLDSLYEYRLAMLQMAKIGGIGLVL